MMTLVPAELDDPAFLSLAERIVNGAVAVLKIHEVYLLHVDNWFDHKWLRWWCRRGDHELRVPLFNPNRILGQKRFVWSVEQSAWESREPGKLLHIRQAGRPWLAPFLDRFSKCAAFVW